MGSHDVESASVGQEAFIHAMLRDIDALELMVKTSAFERGVRRMGAEQEMFLVDRHGQPAPVGPEILRRSDDPSMTSEIGTFNLEVNLPPRALGPHFLTQLEDDLNGAVARVNAIAATAGARVLLTGILPTLHQRHLERRWMSPDRRYHLLDATLRQLRGRPFHISLRGVDDLDATTDAVLYEAANTSFQLHLQTDADRFGAVYDLAQLISAPLLAIACNSPLLFGRRLWRETRVPLFEQATDHRTEAQRARGFRPRVSFGRKWLGKSVVDLFREEAARFPVLLTRAAEPDPVGMVQRGEVPRLRALTLHNGTIWRWNRACYGITDGRPHLRVENRILPAGPSVRDQVANAALFYGLMQALDPIADSIPDRIPFAEAHGNLLAAAFRGLDAGMRWLDGRAIAVHELLTTELLPAAARGLAELGVGAADVERHLGVLRARLATRQTGAAWALGSFEVCSAVGTREAATSALTRAMVARQQQGAAVHTWTLASPADMDRPNPTVGDVVSTDLFTVRPDTPAALARRILEWEHIRHLPVVDEVGRCIGVIRVEDLVGLDGPVSDLVHPPPPEVAVEMPLRHAQSLLADLGIDCLIVTSRGRTCGIVTDADLSGTSAPGA